MAPIDDTPVWSVVCFVVGRKSRGQGMAVALLDAINYARDRGAATLEAYPVDITEGDRSRRRTCTTARARRSNAQGSRSWNGAGRTRPARSDRSSGLDCDGTAAGGVGHDGYGAG